MHTVLSTETGAGIVANEAMSLIRTIMTYCKFDWEEQRYLSSLDKVAKKGRERACDLHHRIFRGLTLIQVDISQ